MSRRSVRQETKGTLNKCRQETKCAKSTSFLRIRIRPKLCSLATINPPPKKTESSGLLVLPVAAVWRVRWLPRRSASPPHRSGLCRTRCSLWRGTAVHSCCCWGVRQSEEIRREQKPPAAICTLEFIFKNSHKQAFTHYSQHNQWRGMSDNMTWLDAWPGLSISQLRTSSGAIDVVGGTETKQSRTRTVFVFFFLWGGGCCLYSTSHLIQLITAAHTHVHIPQSKTQSPYLQSLDYWTKGWPLPANNPLSDSRTVPFDHQTQTQFTIHDMAAHGGMSSLASTIVG